MGDYLIFSKNTVKYRLDDFKLMRNVYNGTLGVIKIALHVVTQTPVILKIIMKYTVISRSKIDTVIRERTLLKQIKHNFIVKLLGTFQDNENLYLVEEFLQGGDLLMMLKNLRVFDVDYARFFIVEIICAIVHLHLRGIVYRALKPENVAMDAQGHVRLLDFGMAKRLRDREKTFTVCGTPEYLAPEILMRRGHDWACD